MTTCCGLAGTIMHINKSENEEKLKKLSIKVMMSYMAKI